MGGIHLKKKSKRIFLITLFCLTINVYVVYGVVDTLKDVTVKEKEKKESQVNLVSLKEKNEELKVEVNKLHDAEYVARYAREKYMYSGKNEYIIRIK